MIDHQAYRKVIVTQGDRETRPQRNDIVEIHYQGFYLESHKEVKFASSHEDFGEPFRTEIGTGKVIKGWDEGIMSMTVGEKAILTIPPDNAYGAAGYPPIIKASTTLKYEIELLKVIKPTAPHPPESKGHKKGKSETPH